MTTAMTADAPPRGKTVRAGGAFAALVADFDAARARLARAEAARAEAEVTAALAADEARESQLAMGDAWRAVLMGPGRESNAAHGAAKTHVELAGKRYLEARLAIKSARAEVAAAEGALHAAGVALAAAMRAAGIGFVRHQNELLIDRMPPTPGGAADAPPVEAVRLVAVEDLP